MRSSASAPGPCQNGHPAHTCGADHAGMYFSNQVTSRVR